MKSSIKFSNQQVILFEDNIPAGDAYFVPKSLILGQ